MEIIRLNVFAAEAVLRLSANNLRAFDDRVFRCDDVIVRLLAA